MRHMTMLCYSFRFSRFQSFNERMVPAFAGARRPGRSEAANAKAIKRQLKE